VTTQTQASDATLVRWKGYRRKRFTAALALVYIARIVAFRVYRLFWRSERWYVSNRYFYDLFVHLQTTTRTERLYHSVVRSLVPVPDVAILVMAESPTIAQRRPNYSREYLSEVGEGYRTLRAAFPELIEIRTDPGELTGERLERIVEERVESAAHRRGAP
jgi:hypothetical protein